jgi:transcriptional regulator with XRE-family HTH domain
MFRQTAAKLHGAMSTQAEYESELAALLTALGENIRRLREAKLPDLSQEEVAERAIVHRTELGLLEAGKRNPRFNTLLALAKTLKVSLDELAEGIDAPVHRKPSPVNKKNAKPPAGKKQAS